MLKKEDIAHIAIFLNDIQRKGDPPKINTSATFTGGHFKVLSIIMHPLYGTYYCDPLPIMKIDNFLINIYLLLTSLLSKIYGTCSN